MATKTTQQEAAEPRESVLRWLLDSDPSIRWQVAGLATEVAQDLAYRTPSRHEPSCDGDGEIVPA